jgi:hypothetical protein
MYKVDDQYRKNRLSLKPGGYSVSVHYPGETRVYDKVKFPEAFCRKILERCEKEGHALPNKIETEEEILWEKS